MTREQAKHIQQIQRDFNLEVSPKYARGADSHGGNLWSLTPLELVDEAMAEALDQYVYLHTLREALRGRATSAAAQKRLRGNPVRRRPS
ncbi:MAG: hypothetical protein ACRD1C_12535 [Terriglobales bacterium]